MRRQWDNDSHDFFSFLKTALSLPVSKCRVRLPLVRQSFKMLASRTGSFQALYWTTHLVPSLCGLKLFEPITTLWSNCEDAQWMTEMKSVYSFSSVILSLWLDLQPYWCFIALLILWQFLLARISSTWISRFAISLQIWLMQIIIWHEYFFPIPQLVFPIWQFFKFNCTVCH